MRVFWNRVHKDPSRSSKVVDFGTNRKCVWDFLLVLNSNLGTILPLSEILRFLCAKIHFFPYPPLFWPKLRSVSFGIDPWFLGSAKSKHPNREIILDTFQPMWSRYLKVTDRRTELLFQYRSSIWMWIRIRNKNTMSNEARYWNWRICEQGT